MKKLFTFALTAAMMLGGGEASAQEYTILQDLTNKIQNADFSNGSPVALTIRTYDYDMAQDGVEVGTSDPTLGLFGMQEVTGWTASSPSDNVRMEKDTRTDGANAKAAGVFAYIDSEGDEGPGLGGNYHAPYNNTEGIGTQALGIVAVWGGEAYYTQDVTLPAGAYMMVVKVWNQAGTSEFLSSGNGFIAGSTKYVSTNMTFQTGVWENDTILFLLEEETAGKISLGYKSGNYGSSGAAHLFIDNVKLYSIDKTPLIQAEIAAAKEELKALIDEGDKTGADTSAATTVYNNPSATLEQVQAAIKQQEELNKAALTDLSAFFLDNPHFADDTPLPNDEGICTYDYDMKDPNGSNGRKVSYYGMQPVEGWTATVLSDNTEVSDRQDGKNARACGVFALGSNSWLGGGAFLPPTTMSDGATEGNVLGFVSVWSAQSQYTQERTLPAGSYKLIISYYNAGGTGTIGKNLMGFVEENGTEHFGSSTSWAVGKWLKDEIEFTLSEDTPGYFSVGYTAANAGSGAMPHFFIDGIALYYVGETTIDPSLMGLQAAISAAQKYTNEAFYTQLKQELNNAISAGKQLVDNKSTDATANKAAADAITALVPQVTACIKAYQALDDFLGPDGALTKAMETYDETTYPDLYAGLEGLSDDAYDANSDYIWSTDEINAAIASLDGIVKEGVQKAWDGVLASDKPQAKPIDISVLFDQLAYTYSATAQQGANVPDKEWQYGDASNFKTQYGTAEVWNQSPFTVSRTLTEMPAGTYTVTTKAFYRQKNNADNYTQYQNNELRDNAFLFAGNNTQALVNLAALAEETHEGWAAIVENEGPYVPGNQQTAHDVFENDAYTETVQASVQTVLTDKGDLTFGVKANAMESDSWVIWYTYSITFTKEVDLTVLRKGLRNLIAEVEDYIIEQHPDDMNDYARNAAAAALEDAEGVVDQGTMAEVTKATQDLNAAYEAAKENVTVWTSFLAARDNIEAVAETYFETATVAAQTAYEELDLYTTPKNMPTEEVKELIDKVNALAQELKIPGNYNTASDDTPVDMTLVINNPSFETGDLTGWTYNTKATGDTKVAENDNETYHIELADGAYVFNTWNSSTPEGDFYVSQVVSGLPAGTYELKAILASDKGNSIVLSANTETQPVEIPEKDEGVELNEKNIGVEASIIFKLEEKGSVEIKASSSSWFKADNFRLTYFGTESQKEPTEISDIDAPAKAATGTLFNIAGQPVGEDYKGYVIKNGKTILKK